MLCQSRGSAFFFFFNPPGLKTVVEDELTKPEQAIQGHLTAMFTVLERGSAALFVPCLPGGELPVQAEFAARFSQTSAQMTVPLPQISSPLNSSMLASSEN